MSYFMYQRTFKKQQEERRARMGALVLIIGLVITGFAIYQRAEAESLITFSNGSVEAGDIDKHIPQFSFSFSDGTPSEKQPELSQNQRQIHELAPNVAYNTIQAYIVETARKYKIDEALFLRIALCENSTLNPTLKNPISGCSAEGIFQFVNETWLSGVKRRGLDWTLADKKDFKKNVDMAAWFITQGEISHWNASKLCWN